MFLLLISYEDESVACAGREFAFIDKELLIKVYLSLIFLLSWPVVNVVVKIHGPLGLIEKMKTSYATSVTTEFFDNSIVQ